MNFTGFMRRFEEDLDKAIDYNGDAYKAAVKTLFASIVSKTPVDSSYLQSNWFVSTSDDSGKRYGSKVSPRSAGAVLSEANTVIDRIEADKSSSTYIINNVEYSPFAEFGLWNGPTAKVTGAGFSRKAPSGMVRVSLTEFERHLRRLSK